MCKELCRLSRLYGGTLGWVLKEKEGFKGQGWTREGSGLYRNKIARSLEHLCIFGFKGRGLWGLGGEMGSELEGLGLTG